MNAIAPPKTAQLLANIASLAPLAAQYRSAMERDRRLPPELFAACADAGLLQLWVPRSLGGPELGFPDYMAVIEAAAAVDGSIGWLAGNGGGMSRATGHLPEQVARAILDTPRALIVATNGAVGEAVPEAGGYRVSGRWPFASFIHHATHVAAAVRLAEGDGQGTILLAFAPAAHATIHDTWHTSGLRGTGSCDYTLDNLLIPRDHVFPMLAPPATQPGRLYRLPAVSVFSATVSLVPLGIARGAMDAFKSSLADHPRVGTTTPRRERETTQDAIGRAETAHAAARALLLAAWADLEAAAEVAHDRLIPTRAAWRAACTHAAETALTIAGTLAAVAGTASLQESNPLERQIRDIQAATKHIANAPQNYITHGRIALGLDPGTASF